MSETLRNISRKNITAWTDGKNNVNTTDNITNGSLQRIADALEKQESNTQNTNVEVIRLLLQMNRDYDKKFQNLTNKYNLLKKRVLELEKQTTQC